MQLDNKQIICLKKYGNKNVPKRQWWVISWDGGESPPSRNVHFDFFWQRHQLFLIFQGPLWKLWRQCQRILIISNQLNAADEILRSLLYQPLPWKQSLAWLWLWYGLQRRNGWKVKFFLSSFMHLLQNKHLLLSLKHMKSYSRKIV